MSKTVLITGGTGLVGRKLVDQLLRKGYNLHLLVRTPGIFPNTPGVKEFLWNVYRKEIDADCIQNVDAIIHLAGEEITRKRWTDERKRDLLQSRTDSIRLIYSLLRTNKHQVEHLVSASAVGYYGDRADEWLVEKSLPSKDFLAETCIAWEEAVDEGHKLGLRIVKMRSGIILDGNGGALPHMAKPLSFWLGIIPGNGRQWVSWIHIKDAVAAYESALENEHMKGAYNLVAPQPVKTARLVKQIALARHRWALFINIPAFLLRLTIGEMSLIFLESSRVSAEKLEHSGFTFSYPTIEAALNAIYSGPKEKHR